MNIADFNLVITMLPGGKVWLHLNGIGRTAIVCDTLQAKEVHMELEDFDKDAFYTFKTLDNSCKLLLSDFEGAAENLEKHGVPLGLWDKYKEWYRYGASGIWSDGFMFFRFLDDK